MLTNGFDQQKKKTNTEQMPALAQTQDILSYSN
jgi:hypothetical protein